MTIHSPIHHGVGVGFLQYLSPLYIKVSLFIIVIMGTGIGKSGELVGSLLGKEVL